MSKKLLCAAVCGAALMSSMPAMAAAPAAAPLNVGFVYISPIGDAGWTTQHDLARKEMEKALGGKVEKYAGGWSVGPTPYDFDGESFTLNAWHRDQVVKVPEGAKVIATNRSESSAPPETTCQP